MRAATSEQLRRPAISAKGISWTTRITTASASFGLSSPSASST
jgi:hypothetical protein